MCRLVTSGLLGFRWEGLVSNGVNYPSWADCDIRAIMKEFRVVLAPLPDNGYLAANSDVTGHVLLVTDEAKSGYKAIEVTLKGYATVCWSETEGSGDNERTVTYYSHEDYIANTAVLWSKDKVELPNSGHSLALSSLALTVSCDGSHKLQFLTLLCILYCSERFAVTRANNRIK